MNSLFKTFQTLLKRRQGVSEALIQETSVKLVKTNQEAILAKKDLVNAKDRIVEQERLMVTVRTELARKSYAFASNNTTENSKAKEMENTLKGLLKQRTFQQDVIDELRMKLSEAETIINKMRSAVDLEERQQNSMITASASQTPGFQRLAPSMKTSSLASVKQVLDEYAPARKRVPLGAEAIIQSATQMGSTGMQSLSARQRMKSAFKRQLSQFIPDMVTAQEQQAAQKKAEEEAQMFFQPRVHERKQIRPPLYHMYTPANSALASNTLGRKQTAAPTERGIHLIANTLLDVANITGKTANESIEAFENGDCGPIMTALFDVDDSLLDEEGRKRREEAIKLFEEERMHTECYKSAKARIEFLKLRERFKLLELQKKIAVEMPSGAVGRFLKRMEDRHKITLQQFEAKKDNLLEARRKQLLLVLQAYSSIALHWPRQDERARTAQTTLEIQGGVPAGVPHTASRPAAETNTKGSLMQSVGKEDDVWYSSAASNAQPPDAPSAQKMPKGERDAEDKDKLPQLSPPGSRGERKAPASPHEAVPPLPQLTNGRQYQ
eukprot:m51a1_g12221 hypothetical protein (553) ;mRNA; r:34061-36400